MEDIDSDDEDPEIELAFIDAGLKFRLFKNVNHVTYMKGFFMLENKSYKEKLPNFYKFMMSRVRTVME